MKIHLLDNANSMQFQNALEVFEKQFYYPLGTHETFSISHGKDHSAFYRSMGNTYCFIAEEQNQVLGVFSCALRQLYRQDSKQYKTIAYLGDLKVSKHKQNTNTYYRLAEAMFNLIHKKTETAIAIVMDGTQKTPNQYTGRLGLPQFYNIIKYNILRISTEATNTHFFIDLVNAEHGKRHYHNICNKDYLQFSLNNIRSNIDPIWLVSKNGDACGKIEDTYHVKRLFTSNGNELNYAHLSHFAFANIEAARELITAALSISKVNLFPYLFLSLTEAEYLQLSPILNSFQYEIAPATLYSNQDNISTNLHFNSAEI